MINQQVLSPTAQPAQQITATPPIMQLQRVLQLGIPPGMLQELQQSVAWDSAVLSDMRAAFQELHDRMYHRTGLLGTAAAHTPQDGCSTVVLEIQRLQSVVDSHTNALETLVSTNSSLRRELDDMHAQLQATTRETTQDGTAAMAVTRCNVGINTCRGSCRTRGSVEERGRPFP